ncbi:hypothetical protein Scep_007138 [Stephania cephalantha]|uniref:Formyl transferase N-terminal domain-containing protein n=1 Tax=Stephania cephalantha TaxID=152367 RepID=A0AAP0K9G5_9MAGN
MTLLRRVSSALPKVSEFAKRSVASSKFPVHPLDAASSSSLVHGVHVFHCPDGVGIVAKLSECIASRGGNILSVDVFVPEKNQVFYSRRSGNVQRESKEVFPKQFWILINAIHLRSFVMPVAVQYSEFVFDPLRWQRKDMDEDFRKISESFSAFKSVVRVPDLDPKYKIAVLVSKQDHCLVDLLHGWQDGGLHVNINCVISNHHRGPNTHVGRFLERHEIPYYYLPTSLGDKREEEILTLVQDTDFLVLARYMQILSGRFLENYGKDIINIHHGLLPSFKGGNPSKQAFDAGVKLIGATSHFVTEELDAGPIIEQMVILFLFLNVFNFNSLSSLLDVDLFIIHIP